MTTFRLPERVRAIIQDFQERGLLKGVDGSLVIPPEMMEQIRADVYRTQTMSRVPSVPTFLQRTVGGAIDRPSGPAGQLSFQKLRFFRDNVPLLSAIHLARATQVRRLSRKWSGRPEDVGWQVVHKDHHAQREVPDYIQLYIKRFEDILERPAPTYDIRTTADLMGLLEEDYLTINRPVVEPLFHERDRTRIVGFRPVDGAIIWPTLEYIAKWRAGRTALDGLSQRDIVDVASVAHDKDLSRVAYVLVRDGSAQGYYEADQLIVGAEQTRTDIRYAGYPPSRLEEALRAVTAFADMWDYNHGLFTRGFMAEQIIALSGDVAEEDVEAFINTLAEAAIGTARAHQPPVIPMNKGDVEILRLKETNSDMMFNVWASLVIAFACAVYRMDPTTINANPWDGSATSTLSAPNRQMEIALAKEEGLQSNVQHLSDSILNELARRCHPDLRVIWHYGDYDPNQAAELADVRTRTNQTVNESRIEEGRHPLGYYLTEDELETASEEDAHRHWANPYNWTRDPNILAIMAQRYPPPAPGSQRDPDGKIIPPPVEPDAPGSGGDGDESPSSPLEKGRTHDHTHAIGETVIIVRDRSHA